MQVPVPAVVVHDHAVKEPVVGVNGVRANNRTHLAGPSAGRPSPIYHSLRTSTVAEGAELRQLTVGSDANTDGRKERHINRVLSLAGVAAGQMPATARTLFAVEIRCL